MRVKTKLPRDTNKRAVTIGQIATGEIIPTQKKDVYMASIGRTGGINRAKALSKKSRKEIAQKAANARWGK